MVGGCGQIRAYRGTSGASGLRIIMRRRGSIGPKPDPPMTVTVSHARGRPACARAAAAMGRRRHLRAVPARRQPSADRSRYALADHGRAVDHRSSDGTNDRRLFLHHARPTLDFHAMAGAGDVREELRAVRLERAGGAGIIRDRGDLCAARKIPRPASGRQHHAGLCRGGTGADRAASSGAAACAGAACHGGLGRRADISRRQTRGAVVLAFAVDRAVGQSAWRLRVRDHDCRADRAGLRARRGCIGAQDAVAALGGVRHRRARGFLLHALWLGFAAGVAKDPRARRGAAADPGMEACRFRQPRPVRDLFAARFRPRAVSRRHLAPDAYRAVAGPAAHGAVTGPRGRNSRIGRADRSRRAAGKADRRRRAATSAGAARRRCLSASPSR